MRFVVAIVLLMAVGCSSGPGTKPQAPAAEQAGSEESSTVSENACPAGIGAQAGDPAIAQILAPGGGALVVCGNVVEHVARNRMIATEFEIHYLKPADDRSDFLLQVESSERREILIDEANGKMVLTEAVPGAPDVALFTQEVVCRDEGCVLEPLRCAFRASAVGDRAKLGAAVKDPRALMNSSEGQTRLALAALSGESRAVHVFMDKRNPGLSGELAESFDKTRQMIVVATDLCGKKGSR